MINRDHPFFANKQELANSLSHALGIIFGIAGVPLLIIQAWKTGNQGAIVGSIVYGISFLMVFVTSTLYHSFQEPRLKFILRKLDHISIYFLIAGSYTPFVLLYVYNDTGITILSILWALTLLGTIFKVWFTGKFDLLSTIIYLLMGWMLIFAGKTFFVSLPAPILTLIAVGGLLYTAGVLFYLWERYHYHHAVWHLFVLAAGICHFVAVWLAVGI
ncbi:MAG: PAQR family membrane homeostasis protein TrhA [Saprospiraceae bacterium]